MEPLAQPEPTPPFDEVEFACALEAMLPALQGYVRSLLLHPDATDDVVQETSLFLWERRAQLTMEHLRATAFRTAWFKALSHRRDRQREKLVHFSEDILQRIATTSGAIAEDSEQRLHALQACIAKLTESDRELLRLKYFERQQVAEHARRQNLPPGRMQRALSRLRLVLRRCIESSLSRQP